MKKFLLVLSVISILFLAGCNLNENVENNNGVGSGDKENQQQIEESIVNNEEPFADYKEQREENLFTNYDSDVEKYKLSDGYIFDIEQEGSSMLTEESRINLEYDENSTIESDGVLFELTNGGSDGYILKSPYTDETIYLGQWIYLVDLDTEDNYKELVSGGDISNYFVYRLKNNSFELLTKDKERFWAAGLYKFDNKYIIPFYDFNERPGSSVYVEYDVIEEKVLTGYLLYEDGEFIYIDRFANGEKMMDDAGKFNEKFTKEIFTSVKLYALLDENGKIMYIPQGTKIKFLRVNNNEIEWENYWSPDNFEYEIEICSDLNAFSEFAYKEMGIEKHEEYFEKGKTFKCCRNYVYNQPY